ncbi:MAG TPA: L-rhamnose/proton symporter RhaT [Candidatus Acidoferrales bacterium]|nr:L-rhamnose/proton symporter RhaT [Candidatus Acidoferrales bacterium]
MNSALAGVLLLVVAGIMNGSFTLPMKFTRQWAWENTWLVWTIWALVIFPPLMTVLTVPHLSSVYASVPAMVIVIVAACGAGWGISQVFFGLAVESVGIALAFSIILGIAAAVGGLFPLIRYHADKLFAPSGIDVLAGVALVIVGVGICAHAGRKREAALGQGVDSNKASTMRGLVYCIISGVGSALVNIGFTSGPRLLTAAEQSGAATQWAPNAIWLPLMVAGGIPNLIYCIYLVRKNHNAKNFSRPGTSSYYILAGIMGVFWFASTLLYGIAAGKMGSLGTAVGWPVFMSMIVITASIWGVLTGEWRGTGRRPLEIMCGGVAMLILAIIVLSRAS